MICIGVEPQVVLGAKEVVQRGVLEYKADGAPDLAPLPHNVVAVDGRTAGGGPDKGAENIGGRRLARAVGAQEAEYLAFTHGEGDPLNGLHPFVPLDQIFGYYYVHFAFSILGGVSLFVNLICS